MAQKSTRHDTECFVEKFGAIDNAVSVRIVILANSVVVTELFRFPAGYEAYVSMEFIVQIFCQLRDDLI